MNKFYKVKILVNRLTYQKNLDKRRNKLKYKIQLNYKNKLNSYIKNLKNHNDSRNKIKFRHYILV